MSEAPYKTLYIGRHDAAIHPCAIDFEMVAPTRYRIVYQHYIVGDRCKVCGESVDWKKIRSNSATVDTGPPDA